MITGPVAGMCSRPMRAQPEVQVEERLQDRRARSSTRTGLTPARRASGSSSRGSIHRERSTPRGACAVTVAGHGDRPHRTAPRRPRRRRRRRRVGRPAAARQARLFGVDYDDDRAARQGSSRAGRAWPVVGVAMHLANGALFGAVYAQRRAAPAAARRGRAARPPGWPSTSPPGRSAAVSDRVHPARDELPALWPATARALRAGDVAPPALRRRARRARAAAERRGRRRAAGLRARRVEQRARQHRARGRRRAGVAARTRKGSSSSSRSGARPRHAPPQQPGRRRPARNVRWAKDFELDGVAAVLTPLRLGTARRSSSAG